VSQPIKDLESLKTLEGVCMSCLTRQLQQNLRRYLKSHESMTDDKAPETVLEELVELGVCPSDVTPDQVSLILESINLG
jgi:hypothetical protein